jgi:hypothetical protein
LIDVFESVNEVENECVDLFDVFLSHGHQSRP